MGVVTKKCMNCGSIVVFESDEAGEMQCNCKYCGRDYYLSGFEIQNEELAEAAEREKQAEEAREEARRIEERMTGLLESLHAGQGAERGTLERVLDALTAGEGSVAGKVEALERLAQGMLEAQEDSTKKIAKFTEIVSALGGQKELLDEFGRVMAVEREADQEDHSLSGELVLRPGVVVRAEQAELEDLFRFPALSHGVLAAGLVEKVVFHEPCELRLYDEHLRCLGLVVVDEHVAHFPELQDDGRGLFGVVGEVLSGVFHAVQPEEARHLVELAAGFKLLYDGLGLALVREVTVLVLAENLTDVLQCEREIRDELWRLVLLFVAPGLRVAYRAQNAERLHVAGEIAVQVGARLGTERGSLIESGARGALEAPAVGAVVVGAPVVTTVVVVAVEVVSVLAHVCLPFVVRGRLAEVEGEDCPGEGEGGQACRRVELAAQRGETWLA